MTDDGFSCPADKLSALRLGRRLAVEVPATTSARRAFVSITPTTVADDELARHEGWARRDEGRSFRVEHWEYDAESIDGFDYDIGAVRVRSALATGESHLLAELRQWQLHPRQFRYAWDSGDPR